MRNNITLKDWGYPDEGILDVDAGGGDAYEMPQEALSPHACDYCRKFNRDDWTCSVTGEDKDPDTDTCEDIDYIEKWLDTWGGFRSPIRCEYSSDETYKQACDAIRAINKDMEEEYEHECNVRQYGKDYWRDSDE